jgi:exodeoxyribonuclease VII large subunit
MPPTSQSQHGPDPSDSHARHSIEPRPDRQSRPDRQPDVQRGLFDDAVPEAKPELVTFTVTRLHTEIKRSLSRFGQFVVTGEAHGVRHRGNVYFKLKERASQISVVVPASKVRYCHVREGEAVAVTGMLDTNSATGDMSIRADSVLPIGDGPVGELLERTRARLRADGLFDRPRLTRPLLPQRVVVVCGTDAAVKHDFQVITETRYPGYPIYFVTATQTTSSSILEGFERALAVPGVDVIVLARGGGDATQLLPYSDEYLCRAIASSPVHVMTAIGHENDRPICDDVADQRAPTPTAAAQLVIPERRVLESRLDSERAHQRQVLRTRTATNRTSIDRHASRRHHIPVQRVAEAGRRLNAVQRANILPLRVANLRADLLRVDPAGRIRSRVDLDVRLLSALAPTPPSLEASRSRLAVVTAQLSAVDPRRVLDRGYAIVRHADGRIVRDATAVTGDEVLLVTLATGTINVVTTQTMKPLDNPEST